MSPDDLRAQRLRAQRLLAPRPSAQVEQVVEDIFALQAQDETAATLGIWARSEGLTLKNVAQARDHARSIVRTWCLRGTLHVVSARDVRWLLDLLRPTLINANRTRRAELGLDDRGSQLAVCALVEMLVKDGPLTRAEITRRLAERGIPAQGQATIHVIGRAALDGLVCYGPDQEGEASFVLFDEWLPPTPPLERDAALAELARRFLQAYGPARPDDLAGWSGLPLRDARRGWAQLGDAAVEVDTTLGPMWMLAARSEWLAEVGGTQHQHATRLLPAYDGLWLGYRERDVLLPAEHRARVYPGGGVLRPCVLVDGQPVGTWTRRANGADTDIVLDLWDTRRATVADLQATVDDLGRFLGRRTRLWMAPKR